MPLSIDKMLKSHEAKYPFKEYLLISNLDSGIKLVCQAI